MLSSLKTALSRLFGGGDGATREQGAPAEPVEYKGYRIRPAPYRADRLYQTAGVIEKDTPDGTKQHRFVRADTHQSHEDAVTFAVMKAKQIIDLQGDRIFGEGKEG
jgi:hypothetical protein